MPLQPNLSKLAVNNLHTEIMMARGPWLSYYNQALLWRNPSQSYNVYTYIVKRNDLYVSKYVCNELVQKVLDGFG